MSEHTPGNDPADPKPAATVYPGLAISILELRALSLLHHHQANVSVWNIHLAAVLGRLESLEALTEQVRELASRPAPSSFSVDTAYGYDTAMSWINKTLASA